MQPAMLAGTVDRQQQLQPQPFNSDGGCRWLYGAELTQCDAPPEEKPTSVQCFADRDGSETISGLLRRRMLEEARIWTRTAPPSSRVTRSELRLREDYVKRYARVPCDATPDSEVRQETWTFRLTSRSCLHSASQPAPHYVSHLSLVLPSGIPEGDAETLHSWLKSVAVVVDGVVLDSVPFSCDGSASVILSTNSQLPRCLGSEKEGDGFCAAAARTTPTYRPSSDTICVPLCIGGAREVLFLGCPEFPVRSQVDVVVECAWKLPGPPSLMGYCYWPRASSLEDDLQAAMRGVNAAADRALDGGAVRPASHPTVSPSLDFDGVRTMITVPLKPVARTKMETTFAFVPPHTGSAAVAFYFWTRVPRRVTGATVTDASLRKPVLAASAAELEGFKEIAGITCDAAFLVALDQPVASELELVVTLLSGGDGEEEEDGVRARAVCPSHLPLLNGGRYCPHGRS